jgi:glycosyltransferase involved in cell wall biosynthesis
MKKILFVLTEDYFFLSHFQPMARAASRLGLEVVVAARSSSAATKIVELGYRFIPNEIGRAGSNFVGIAKSVVSLRRILAQESPDIVHAIALPPAVVSALATIGTKRPVILAPTGLGHLWVEHDLATSFVRGAVRTLLKISSRRPSVHFLFENSEDPLVFGLDPHDGTKVTVVGGAGVSPTEFGVKPLPAGAILQVAIVSRMTASKGIEPAVEAVRQLRAEGKNIHLHLYGDPDTGNKRSISLDTLEAWNREGGVTWHGHTSDVGAIWANAHVAALLSWREGLPRALVEAMASGRPVVASDVPGCRTLVRNGVEGLLVPVESVEATLNAFRFLLDNPAERAEMGVRARKRFEDGFTEADVESVATALYKQLLLGYAKQAGSKAPMKAGRASKR